MEMISNRGQTNHHVLDKGGVAVVVGVWDHNGVEKNKDDDAFYDLERQSRCVVLVL